MMEKRDGATIRRERIQRINKRITGPDMLPQSLDYILAHIQYTEGVTEQNGIEILKVIETLGFIEIDWTMRWVTKCKVRNIDDSNSKNG